MGITWLTQWVIFRHYDVILLNLLADFRLPLFEVDISLKSQKYLINSKVSDKIKKFTFMHEMFVVYL